MHLTNYKIMEVKDPITLHWPQTIYMRCHQGLDIGGKPLGTWKLELDT